MSNVSSKLRKRRQENFFAWLEKENYMLSRAVIRGTVPRRVAYIWCKRQFQEASQKASVTRWHKQHPQGDFRLRGRGNHTPYTSQQ